MARTGGAQLSDHQLAGAVTRFVAFVVDAAIVSLLAAGLTWFVGSIHSFFQIRDVPRVNARALVAAAIPVMVVAYNVLFWSLSGRTPGKWLLGLKVVGPDGQPPAPLRALLRFAGYFVSAIPLYLGFAWILVDRERRGFHDLIAGTHVIYVRSAERVTRAQHS